MASVDQVPITSTPKGVRVALGKLYMYPDGHANLTFDSVSDGEFEGLNLPLTNAVDVISELTSLVKRMNDTVVQGRPGRQDSIAGGPGGTENLPRAAQLELAVNWMQATGGQSRHNRDIARAIGIDSERGFDRLYSWMKADTARFIHRPNGEAAHFALTHEAMEKNQS
jgi:hypothetical protein